MSQISRSSKFRVRDQRQKISTDYQSRIKLIKFLVLIWALVLVFRLVNLQIINPEKWIEWANKQHLSKIQLAGQRGRIIDRTGSALAVSVPSSSLFLRPGQVQDQNRVVEVLSQQLELEQESIAKKLESTQPFVWVERQLPRYMADQIAALKLDGVGAIIESRRYYPYGNVASTLIGKVGVDGNGLSGLEAFYEKTLNPKQQTYLYLKDALGNKIDKTSSLESDLVGKDIKLTIDAELQQFCNKELLKAVAEHEAKQGVAVLINAENGEILALSQAPSINFNFEKIKSKADLTNYSLQAAYEPGSTFKPIVAALALEKEVVTLDQIINTEDGKFKIGRNTVKDVHASLELSVKDVVVHSSNIGMSKIAFDLGADDLYQGLKSFGFGSQSNLELSGEASGILRNPKNWAEIDLATHSFGQGVAVSAIQLVRAFAVLVNGGYLVDLKILADDPTQKKQIISKEVSEMLRETLVAVVEEESGTGKNAAIDKVIVGGKTGTAQKAKTDGRGYQEGAYLASFIGFADARQLGINQQLVLLVMIDEPMGRSIYGGTVAAPAFKNIISKSLFRMGIRDNL